MAAWAPSLTISWAAIATACKPDEQKRLTVTPGTVTGRPARIAAMRATFVALRAMGIGAAQDDVLDFGGT